MAIDKNKILATESQVVEICASNGMALTAGALTWNGTFDNLYRVPIGSENDMDFGFVRVTEEVPDDFSILVSLEMEVPTFFGVASALAEPIYQGLEIMPEIDLETGIYQYYSNLDLGMPLAVIACEGNAAGMPAGVYFLYASIMDKPVMSVSSMRLPSYAFNSNNYFVTEQNIIEIPNQNAYYWDGDYNSCVKQGTLQFGEVPLTFYSKYVGECDLAFEELANKRVIGIYKDETECIIQTRIHDNYMELYPMTYFAFSSVFITKEANVQVNEYVTLAEPGVHFICINYPTVPPLTYIDIEDSVHTLCSTNKTQVIQKSHLPEYLQLGDINETYTVQKLVGEATNNLGETLYWDANNIIDTGDMTRECRVADAIEIPANTVITGVHNETGKTINLVIVDNKIWASDNVPTNGTSPNSGYYAIIRKTGIYLCNFGSGGGSSSAYGSYLSSITFSGMNFTKTIYNIESEKIETTEFKTLDKKYLPEISYKDLIDKPTLCYLTFVASGNNYRLEYFNQGQAQSIPLTLFLEKTVAKDNTYETGAYDKKYYSFDFRDLGHDAAVLKLYEIFNAYQKADRTRVSFIGDVSHQGIGNSCSLVSEIGTSFGGLYFDMGMVQVRLKVPASGPQEPM